MCKTITTAMRDVKTSNKASKPCVTKASCSAVSKKQSVRFAGTVMVCLKPTAEQEADDTWYSRLEYKQFQRDSKRSLLAVTSNLGGNLHAYDASQHCFRGLEACISPEVYVMRKEEKSNIVAEVLKQQLFNRILGVTCSENLAVLSKGLSQQAQQRALMLAALDCREHCEHQGCLSSC